MSVIFRRGAKFCLSAVGLAFAVAGALGASAEVVEKKYCNDSGECSRAVDAAAEILRWCEASSATIAFLVPVRKLFRSFKLVSSLPSKVFEGHLDGFQIGSPCPPIVAL